GLRCAERGDGSDGLSPAEDLQTIVCRGRTHADLVLIVVLRAPTEDARRNRELQSLARKGGRSQLHALEPVVRGGSWTGDAHEISWKAVVRDRIAGEQQLTIEEISDVRHGGL